MGKKLTDAQIASFKSDGFLSPVDLFSEEEASSLRAQFEEAERRWPEAFAGAARSNAHYNFTFLDRIVHDPGLLDAMEDLVGPNILNYGTVLFIKEPRDPGFVSWHQDSRYLGLTPPDAGVTVWVALSPANEQSGCMQMIPGSHTQGLVNHVDTFGETNILTRGQDIASVDPKQAVATPLRPGQASFHSMTVIHGSAPNNSDDRRIGFAIQSYLPTHVTSETRVPAQLVRGEDSFGNFDPIGRPTQDMAEGDVVRRDEVNQIWADILYKDADKRRNL